MMARIKSLVQRYLSRITSSGEFIPEVDGLRFVAITGVLVSHLLMNFLVKTGRIAGVGEIETLDAGVCERFLITVLLNGTLGVQLFFVISGFILGMPFARAHFGVRPMVKLRAYFLRRLTRLEPPYIICLVLLFSAAVWMGRESFAGLLPHLLASILYLHNAIYGEYSRVNGVAWTLEIEVQFYLLAPLLASVFRIGSKAFRRAVLCASILGLSAMVALLPYYSRFSLSLGVYLQYFLVGFLLADIYISDWRNNPQTRWWGDFGVLGFAALCIWVVTRQRELLWLMPVGMFAMTWFVFQARFLRRLLNAWPIVIIGGMCYTIYLYHFSLMLVVGPLFRRWHQNGWMATPAFLVQLLLLGGTILLVCSFLDVSSG